MRNLCLRKATGLPKTLRLMVGVRSWAGIFSLLPDASAFSTVTARRPQGYFGLLIFALARSNAPNGTETRAQNERGSVQIETATLRVYFVGSSLVYIRHLAIYGMSIA